MALLAWMFAMTSTTRQSSSSRLKARDPLDEPIVVNPWVVGVMAARRTAEAEAAVWREADTWIREEKLRKLSLLARRYKIDITHDHGWSLLALKLAEERYDGFRVVDREQGKKRGRPPGSTKIGGRDLVKAVFFERQPADRGISNACKRLTRKKGRWKNADPKSLETQYYAFLRSTKDLSDAAKANPFIQRLEQAARAATDKP